MKILEEQGLTFDDALLVPRYSKVLPRQVNVGTRLTKNITLNIPIVSAAMSSTTMADMAIAMPCSGGLGVIHKNMSLVRQAEEVGKVKRWKNGFIFNPVTLCETQTMGEARRVKSEKGFSCYPIENDNGVIVGIITKKDFKRNSSDNAVIRDIMTQGDDLRTALDGISLEEAQKLLNEYKIEKLPIVDVEGKLTSLVTYDDIEKATDFPNMLVDAHGRLLVGAAVGVEDDTMDRVKALVDAGVDVIFLDSAHAHSLGVMTTLKKIKRAYPTLDVVVGNVATKEAAEALVKAGADGLKVGIGPGSICTTRVIAGAGVPQLSAIIHVVAGAGKIPVIADGGIKWSGDIVKALAAGACAVMIGSLLAGTEEAPGTYTNYRGRRYKDYYGMGSQRAMEEGSKDRYFQGGQSDPKKLVSEGIEGRVPDRGPVHEVLHQLIGGLRSGMGYNGAETLAELYKHAEFIRISNAGLRESHPHDVEITKEASNYSQNN